MNCFRMEMGHKGPFLIVRTPKYISSEEENKTGERLEGFWPPRKSPIKLFLSVPLDPLPELI